MMKKKLVIFMAILFTLAFCMPLFSACNKNPTFKITVEECVNGKISVAKKKSSSGEIITVTVTPDNGFKLKPLTLKQNNITISGNSFRMPSNDVILTAEFEHMRENERLVTVVNATNGTVEAEKEYFAKDEMVYLHINPADGYRLKNESLKFNGNVITTDFAFTMPFENVVVTAEFERLPNGYAAIVTEKVADGRIIASVSSAKIGDEVTVKTIPNNGYQIARNSLMCDGKRIENAKFLVTTARTLVKARFIKTEYLRVNEMGYSDPNGTYMLFGYYPTTVKANNVSVDSKAEEDGYYKGNDGEKYVKLKANPFDVNFNFSNGRLIQGGIAYYFKLERVKWKILSEDGEGALLLAENILDADYYLASQNIDGNYNIKEGVPTNINANNWKYSDAKNYLQKVIYNGLFDDFHKYFIANNIIDNEDVKISLMSYNDIKNANYGFNSDPAQSDEKRVKITTDYARAKGAFINTTKNTYGAADWMIRTPPDTTKIKMRAITSLGASGTANRVDFRGAGFVPLVKLIFS